MYGPMSYYALTVVGPQTRTRQPYPRTRKRKRFLVPGVAGVRPPGSRRSAVLAVSLEVADDQQFRVRIQQTLGTESPILVARSSSFNATR